MSQRWLAVTAAVLGLAGVVCAAAGAHVLPADLPDSQRLWATALQLHLFHATALLAIAALAGLHRSPWICRSGWVIATGAVLFSGTLYLRAAGIDILPGPLTPLGGLIAMLGWVSLIVTLIKKNPI